MGGLMEVEGGALCCRNNGNSLFVSLCKVQMHFGNAVTEACGVLTHRHAYTEYKSDYYHCPRANRLWIGFLDTYA